MYEEHIEAFENCFAEGKGPLRDAADAAIELMRAAEPKDAAAEREHCRKKAREFGYSETWIEIRAEELMRERAQVRAEGYAAAWKDGQQYRDLVHSAGRDEFEVLQSAVDELEEKRVELLTKLKAAQTKIEELLKKVVAQSTRASRAETKLTNLRTAAERAYQISSDPEASEILRAAIEESKK